MYRLLRFLSLAILMCVLSARAAVADPKHVFIFGDSITWGWIPTAKGIPTERYPIEKQWPSVLKATLGSDFDVEVDALSGRTTDVADPSFPQLTGAGMDGAAYLPAAIAAHLPLDLVVIMLGTNDTKAQFARTPFRIALGAGRLISIVQSSGNMFGGNWYTYPAPKVLLVSPPPLGHQNVFAAGFLGGEERSRGLAKAYSAIAEMAGVSFFDAGSVVATDGVDGVHLKEESQRKLGEALAAQVRMLLR